MDLGAYTQIYDLEHIMEENGISVPRLRGLRLMADEKPLSKEEIASEAYEIGVNECMDACENGFSYNAYSFELSERTDRLIHKYLSFENQDDTFPNDVKWTKVHGRKRKLFKYKMKTSKRRVEKQYNVFNKYCGREDVLYIHARIGGNNWNYYGGDELTKQPWFLEKVDDAFDSTYCDIYARITKEQEHEDS